MPPIAYVESSGPSAGDRPDSCSWHFHLGRYPAVGPTKAAKIEDVLYIGFRVDGSWVISPDTSVGFAVRYEFFHLQSVLQAFIFFFSVSSLVKRLSMFFNRWADIFIERQNFSRSNRNDSKITPPVGQGRGLNRAQNSGVPPGRGHVFFDDIFY